MEDGGLAVTGIVYEKHSNINYYCYYENGIKNGVYVDFYDSKKIKKFRIMQKGQIYGESIEWFESRIIKVREYCKYGIVTYSEKWDEKGVLVDKKVELNDFEKNLILKYESIKNN